MSWSRLDHNFYTDGKLARAGWRATLLWPVILARLGEGGGVRSADDLDAFLIARLIDAPIDIVEAALASLYAAGLLVEGSIRKRGGPGGSHEDSGIVTPQWRKYNPDSGSVTTVTGGTVLAKSVPEETPRNGHAGVAEETVPNAGRYVTDGTDVTNSSSVREDLRQVERADLGELAEWLNCAIPATRHAAVAEVLPTFSRWHVKKSAEFARTKSTSSPIGMWLSFYAGGVYSGPPIPDKPRAMPEGFEEHRNDYDWLVAHGVLDDPPDPERTARADAARAHSEAAQAERDANRVVAVETPKEKAVRAFNKRRVARMLTKAAEGAV